MNIELTEQAIQQLEKLIQKNTDLRSDQYVDIGGARLQIGPAGGRLVNGRYNTQRFNEILRYAVEQVNSLAELEDPNILTQVKVDKSLEGADHQQLGKALGDVFEVLVFSKLSEAITKAIDQGSISSRSGTTIMDQESSTPGQFLNQYNKVYGGGTVYQDLIKGLEPAANSAVEQIVEHYFKNGATIRLSPKAGSSKEGDLILQFEVNGKIIRHVLELKAQFSPDNMITWSTLSDSRNYGISSPAIGKYKESYDGSFGSYVLLLMKQGLYSPEGSVDFISGSPWLQQVTSSEQLKTWMSKVSGKRTALSTFKYFLAKGEATEILSRKSLIVGAYNHNENKTEVILDLEETIKNFPNTKENKMKYEDRKKSVTWKIGTTSIGALKFEKFGSSDKETPDPIPGEQVEAESALWRYTVFKMTVNPRRWKQFQK